MIETAEVIVVGAGVAGLSLALRLGRAGRSVLLIDKADSPRDKVCGEGVMPIGIAMLAEMGLNATELPGHDFCGLDYRSRRRGRELSFASGVTGRGIRRTTLIAALERAALGCAGVTLRKDEVVGPLWAEKPAGKQGGALRGVKGRGASYHGQVVVAADGVQSPLALAVGIPAREHGYRMGLRRHYRLSGAAAAPENWRRVKVGLFAPHDIYLTPVGDGTVLATTMTDRGGYEPARADYEGFLRATPFGGYFRDAEPASELLGWHHPLRTYREREAGGPLLIGDAGGSLDPCLGLGVSLALLTAAMAAEAALAMLEEPARRAAAARKFRRAARALFRHYRLFDYIFRLMVTSGTSSELLLWGMENWPGTADDILGIVAEGHPWRTFSWRSLVLPGRGRA